MLPAQGAGSDWRSGVNRPAAAGMRSGEKGWARDARRAGEKDHVGRILIRDSYAGAGSGESARGSCRAHVIDVALVAQRFNATAAGFRASSGMAFVPVPVSRGAGVGTGRRANGLVRRVYRAAARNGRSSRDSAGSAGRQGAAGNAVPLPWLAAPHSAVDAGTCDWP